MVETRTFCVNVVTYGLKFTILMLSDQVKLSYMLITKENYMLNHMKLPLYHL